MLGNCLDNLQTFTFSQICAWSVFQLLSFSAIKIESLTRIKMFYFIFFLLVFAIAYAFVLFLFNLMSFYGNGLCLAASKLSIRFLFSFSYYVFFFGCFLLFFRRHFYDFLWVFLDKSFLIRPFVIKVCSLLCSFQT